MQRDKPGTLPGFPSLSIGPQRERELMTQHTFSSPSQSEYTLGKDLNLLPFELFNHVKADRLHPLDEYTGQAIPRPDVFRIKEKMKKITDAVAGLPLSPEQYENLLNRAASILKRARLKKQRQVNVSKDEHFVLTCITKFETLSKKLKAITDIYDWTTYKTPENPIPVFVILQKAIFKKSEVEQLNATDGGQSPTQESVTETQDNPAAEEPTPTATEMAVPKENSLDISVKELLTEERAEEFIQTMEVTFVSDTEIKIKVGKNKARIFDQQTLGFKKANSKIWQVFIKIIRGPEHTYHVGKSRGANRARKNSYDVGQKYLDQINDKICTFLNKTYQEAQLPKTFKVHELIPQKKEAPGTYRFKFKITDDIALNKGRYDNLSKVDLIADIEELSKKVKELSECYGKDKEIETEELSRELQTKVVLALEKKWIGPNQANGYLNPPSDIE